MFVDRTQAGKRLAEALSKYKGTRALVLALPRGGIPVAFEIAKVLHCPLDTIVARKVGAPGNPEYAVGAIAPGVRVLDEGVYGIEEVVEEETKEMNRRIEKYRSGSYARSAEPDVAIVVDDGVATGKTAIAALKSARAMYPNAIRVFAAPVCAPDSLRALSGEADAVVVLEIPAEFMAVGEWYASFPQLRDHEVLEYLEKARKFGSPEH